MQPPALQAHFVSDILIKTAEKLARIIGKTASRLITQNAIPYAYSTATCQSISSPTCTQPIEYNAGIMEMWRKVYL